MAKQTVNIGASENAGDGDPLRTAFNKINSNFNEIYNKGPVGTNLTSSGNTVQAGNTNGDVTLTPNGTGNVVINDNNVIIATPRTITTAAGSIGDTAGMIAWDTNYLYVCTASYNSASPSAAIWKRASIGTW
jgi:hypothetical protein